MRRPLLAWLALVGALVLTRALGGGFWATNLVYGPAVIGLPLLLARGRDLGLVERSPWLSLRVFALLSLLTLPLWFSYRGPAVRFAAFPAQLFLVALPEEFFFRGFLQGEWARAARRRVRLFGARVGWEWPAAAAAFALTHVVGQGAAGLWTFFPGLLFGWAYARTRSIWAGVLYHAACNVVA